MNEGRIFLQAEKIACITPAFKKEDRLNWTNYRPITVLNVFSKVFERFILDQLTSYFKSILSEFRSAYRKQYSCQHVLLRMIETCANVLTKKRLSAQLLRIYRKLLTVCPMICWWRSPGGGGGGTCYVEVSGDVPFS